MYKRQVLTKKQREMLRQYYNDDLSLSEIGENFGITRQGARDAIKPVSYTHLGKACNGDQHAVSGFDAHTAVEALFHTVVLAGTLMARPMFCCGV